MADCSGESQLRPFEAHSQGCGRGSALGFLLKGMVCPLMESGNVVGRRRGNLTGGPCDSAAGGGSLDKTASLEW